jgi:tetratricopeptide (TPR) repeat protein
MQNPPLQAVAPQSEPPAGGGQPLDGPSPALRPGLLLFAAAAVAAITFAVYAGAPGHAFVNWDDPRYVTENPLVLGKQYGALLTAIVSHHYHPVTMISLAMNVATPLSPRPFLATNVLIHVLNTLLVFWLVWLLSRRRLLVATFVALLFGIHPMHVESVAWISERKDVLYAFFFLAGLIAYWRHLERRTWPRLALVFALFVLSCLAKGQAVVFPLVMGLLDYWKGRPVLERRSIVEKVPFLAISLLFGAITMDAQAGRSFHGLLHIVGRAAPGFGKLPNYTLLERVTLPTYGYLMYVWRLFVPAGLSTFNPYPRVGAALSPEYLLAPLFFVATLALALWALRRSRPLAFGLGWYVATVALVLQWIPVGAALTADRYSYLSSIGIFFILGMGLQALRDRDRTLGAVGWGAAGLFAALLFVQTIHQIGTWKDSEALWSRTIQVHPDFASAYVYRGMDRHASGRDREARSDYQTAFGLGLRAAEVYEGLGSSWVALGRLDSALVMFDDAVRAEPDRGLSYYNRGAVLLGLGRARDAITDLDRATLLMSGETATVFGTRGYAKMQLGDFAGAAADFDRAIAQGARDPAFPYGRGYCRLRMGDRVGAADDFRATLRLDPRHAAAGAALRSLGL